MLQPDLLAAILEADALPNELKELAQRRAAG
jgi:hypothetical protein